MPDDRELRNRYLDLAQEMEKEREGDQMKKRGSAKAEEWPPI